MSLISDERAEELLANEKEKDAEIERLKKRLALHKILMTHAADALEKWTITPDTQTFLVDALRKAAE